MRSDCPKPKPGTTKLPDPDIVSPTLKEYHRLLWSKQLPNGKFIDFETGNGCYLKWNDFYLGSDSIIVSFMHARFKLRELVKNSIPNYAEYREQYQHKGYTIGGSIIFPQHRWSMNQARGCSRKISDRWDLTLECIRCYYHGEPNPLESVFEKDTSFFNLFVDFKGYVDFFHLQDLVTENYSAVEFLCWFDGFHSNYPLPRTVEEYNEYINRVMKFSKSRNERIATWCRENSRLL
jgi:hypothetical protein